MKRRSNIQYNVHIRSYPDIYWWQLKFQLKKTDFFFFLNLEFLGTPSFIEFS